MQCYPKTFNWDLGSLASHWLDGFKNQVNKSSALEVRKSFGRMIYLIVRQVSTSPGNAPSYIWPMNTAGFSPLLLASVHQRPLSVSPTASPRTVDLALVSAPFNCSRSIYLIPCWGLRAGLSRHCLRSRANDLGSNEVFNTMEPAAHDHYKMGGSDVGKIYSLCV